MIATVSPAGDEDDPIQDEGVDGVLAATRERLGPSYEIGCCGRDWRRGHEPPKRSDESRPILPGVEVVRDGQDAKPIYIIVLLCIAENYPGVPSMKSAFRLIVISSTICSVAFGLNNGVILARESTRTTPSPPYGLNYPNFPFTPKTRNLAKHPRGEILLDLPIWRQIRWIIDLSGTKPPRSLSVETARIEGDGMEAGESKTYLFFKFLLLTNREVRLMELTRRKAVLGIGAAVLAPLMTPGETVACLFGHRKHRRVACAEPVLTCSPQVPSGEQMRIFKPGCVESVGSILFAPTCCRFKLGTAVKFTMLPVTGAPFTRNRVDIVDRNSFTGATTSIAWSAPTIDATTSGAQLVVWSTPTLRMGMPMPTTTSNLTITIHSNINSLCDQTIPYLSSYLA